MNNDSQRNNWWKNLIAFITILFVISFFYWLSFPVAKWRLVWLQEKVYSPRETRLDTLSKEPSFTVKDKVDIFNESQQQFLQVLGSIALLIGIYVTWKRLIIAEKTLTTTNKNLEVTEKGHFTERFTKAIEQLGDEKKSVQLGGIYSLEKLAKEREEYHNVIFEILCAFLRDTSPYILPRNGQENHLQEVDHIKKENLTLVKAVISVISNRRYYSFENPFIIDLSHTNLCGTIFKQEVISSEALVKKARQALPVYLNTSSFNDSYLIEVDFLNAELQGASFKNANLQRAKLLSCKLQGVSFENANLRGAYLQSAKLQNAQLVKADLAYSYLRKTNFKEANLQSAVLKGAIIQETVFQGANLLRANLQGAICQNPNFEDAKLIFADLRNCEQLKSEALLNAKTLYKCKLDENHKLYIIKHKPELLEKPRSSMNI